MVTAAPHLRRWPALLGVTTTKRAPLLPAYRALVGSYTNRSKKVPRGGRKRRITTRRHRTGCAGISCCARSASGSARIAPPAARKSSASGSHWTLRWRKMDSNHRYPAKFFWPLVDPRAIHLPQYKPAPSRGESGANYPATETRSTVRHSSIRNLTTPRWCRGRGASAEPSTFPIGNPKVTEDAVRMPGTPGPARRVPRRRGRRGSFPPRPATLASSPQTRPRRARNERHRRNARTHLPHLLLRAGLGGHPATHETMAPGRSSSWTTTSRLTCGGSRRSAGRLLTPG